MSKKYLKFIPVILLCLSTLFQQAKAQVIVVEAKLERSTIRIGEQTKLQVNVYQPVKEKVNFPKLADTLTGKVFIAGTVLKNDTAFDQNDKNRYKITKTYIITSFDEGTYTIPPFTVGTSVGTLKTNDLTLQVQTVKVDTTKAIYDIKQPLAVHYTLWDWLRDHWLLVVIIWVILFAIVGFIVYLEMRPKKVATAPVIKTYLPPHVIAINKLQELRSKKIWQQPDFIKQHYIELSDILRDYLEARYAVKTQEKTTDEILSGIKHLDIKDADRLLLKQVLVLSDLVKFAKEKPAPAENEETIINAITFVGNTKQVVAPGTEGGNANGAV